MSTVFLIKYGGTWQQSFEMWSKIHDFKVVWGIQGSNLFHLLWEVLLQEILNNKDSIM
jgi:hypothetical protein